MTAFRYEALSAQGAIEKGVIHADAPRAARAQLREQGLTPLAVETVGDTTATSNSAPKPARRLFKSLERGLLIRQLASLLVAELPVEKALGAMLDDLPKAPQRDAIAQVRAEIQAGASLAQALAHFPKDFPADVTAVVGAGEQSGQLAAVLTRLADDLEATEALRGKLMGAALYPAIVSAVAVVMVVFLMSFVVPQVASVFAAREQALPLLTRFMLAASDFVRSWGLVIGAGLGLATIAAVLGYRQSPACRLRVDATWLRLPLIGGLLRDYHNARLASLLGLLSSAGLPILKGLHTAADALGNAALRAEVLNAQALVREGASLAAALQGQSHVARWLVLFARLGEQTGQLGSMLSQAAQQNSDRVQRKSLGLATILEPLLILAMGLIVLTIVLSVLMPIMELNRLAGT